GYVVCSPISLLTCSVFFFQAEDGIRAFHVTGVQTCALPICGGVGLRQRRLPPGGRGGGAAAGAGPSARTDHEAPLHPLAVGRGGGGGGPPGASGGGEPGGAAGGGGRPPLPTPARGPGLPGGQRWVVAGLRDDRWGGPP